MGYEGGRFPVTGMNSRAKRTCPLGRVESVIERTVSGSMSANMDRSIVMDAFNMAVNARRPSAGRSFQSDRGSKYVSRDYRETLAIAGAIQSMSGKGNCYAGEPRFGCKVGSGVSK